MSEAAPTSTPAPEELKIQCDSCGKPLTALGALLFSGPIARDVKKYHVCVYCFDSKFKPLIKP